MSDDLVQLCGKDVAADLRRNWPTHVECTAAASMLEQAADALARKDAEIAELRADRDSWSQQASERVRDWDEMRNRAERAEARVREAPVARVERWAGAAWVLHKRDLETVHPPIVGKRVALVLLDTEE